MTKKGGYLNLFKSFAAMGGGFALGTGLIYGIFLILGIGLYLQGESMKKEDPESTSAKGLMIIGFVFTIIGGGPFVLENLGDLDL